MTPRGTGRALPWVTTTDNRHSSELTQAEAIQIIEQQIRNAHHVNLYELLVIDHRLYNVVRVDGKITLLDLGMYTETPDNQKDGSDDESPNPPSS